MEIIISNSSDKPIYEQICMQVKSFIMDGTLSAGEALPSMRALAKDLHISVITVQRAYEDLTRDGFIETVSGKGSFVASQNREFIQEEQLRIAEELLQKVAEILIDDNMVFDIDNLKGFLNDTSSFGFIAKENNKIIGFAYCYTLLRPDGKTMFYLHSIGMLPNYQDKGYGSKLLSFIKEYSKEIGCSEMFLITDKGNPRACHVYEKLGGKNDYKDEIVYVYDYEKGDK